jgi:SpoVK/Ycf46/Vps4 family AAA+-type ATPase
VAKSDIVERLIRAHYQTDAVAFSKAVTELIREEEKKKNLTVAEAYRAALRPRPIDNGQPVPAGVSPAMPDQNSKLDMLTVQYSNTGLDSVVLSQRVEQQISELAMEWKHRGKLLDFGLRPRNKVLLYGPPGCGKTATAAALAGELGLPLVLVRFDSLISSFLGQTGSNIKRVFDYANSTPCILFMDEFDALAKMRDDQNELGELKRVVITLLQNIDHMGSDSVFVAATNHAVLLDNALWRRFDLLCKMNLPCKQERILILKNKCSVLTEGNKLEYDVLSELTEGFSGADLTQAVEGAWRKCVLTDRIAQLGDVLLEQAFNHAVDHDLVTHEGAFAWAVKLRSYDPRRYSYAALEVLLGIPHSTLHSRLSKERVKVAAETTPTSGNTRSPGGRTEH